MKFKVVIIDFQSLYAQTSPDFIGTYLAPTRSDWFQLVTSKPGTDTDTVTVHNAYLVSASTKFELGSRAPGSCALRVNPHILQFLLLQVKGKNIYIYIKKEKKRSVTDTPTERVRQS